ncbi:MAG: hypothetical protein NTV58_16180, partial [Deltaproteobacteria bacterium]|nr:hypothetical protein [Deltaproteobacteria bacterium]
VEIWEEIIVRVPDDVFALVELATWHEHRARDYAQALSLARQALHALSLPSPETIHLKNARFCHSGLDPESSNDMKILDSGFRRNDDRERLRRRIARLERRLARDD